MSDWQDISTLSDAAALCGSGVGFELRNARGKTLRTARGGEPVNAPPSFRGPFIEWRMVDVKPEVSHKPGESDA